MQNIFFSRFIACFFIGFFLNSQAIAFAIQWNKPGSGYFRIDNKEKTAKLKLEALQEKVSIDEGALARLDAKQKVLRLQARKLQLKLVDGKAKNKKKIRSANQKINELKSNHQLLSTDFQQLNNDKKTLESTLKILNQKNVNLQKVAKTAREKLQREIDQTKFYQEKLALVERRSLEFFNNQKSGLPVHQQMGLTDKEQFDLTNQEQFNLANQYRNRKDYTKALHLYLKLSEKGYARAQLNTGHMYYSGFGTTKDLDVALAFYLQAAMQGIAEAQYLVAYLLDKNSKYSLFWYKQAAQQGNTEAQKVISQLQQK
jgi:hypothetical protein